MRFIHTGDLHCNRERIPLVCEVLEKIIDECSKRNDDGTPYIDAVLICGDFWDSTITNSDASGFTAVLDKMEELSAYARNVHMIYGTPSHEPNGSLHVFEKLGVDVLYQDGMPYAPSYHHVLYDLTAVGKEYELIAIPEPRLSLTAGGTLEEKYAAVQESYRKTAMPRTRSDLKRIVMFHGLIHGAVLDNGMSVPKGETAIDREVLDAMEADYIACAHIHRRQQVGGMRTPCWYCGSAPAKNFGETHEAAFLVVEV